METFEQLKNLMSTDKNYLTYRNVVKLANPPCIPYLGVFLTDLVFIDEAPGMFYLRGGGERGVGCLKFSFSLFFFFGTNIV